jgi:hypothetical protein
VWVSSDGRFAVTMDDSTIFESTDPSVPMTFTDAGSFANGTGVWGTTMDDVWMISTTGNLIRRGTSGWGSSINVTAGPLSDIDGIDLSELWIVGKSGYAARYSASVFLPDSPGPFDLETVWVPPQPNDTHAVVAGDGVYRRTGPDGGWRTVYGANAPYFWNSIFGWSADDYWVVGRAGGVLHVVDGGATRVEVGTRNDLVSVIGRELDGGRELWIGGVDGLVLRKQLP